MEKYKIFCTEEQTKKALELGAPIERGHESSRYFNIGVPTLFDEKDEICRVKNSVIFIPTAEQMMGWLITNGFAFGIIDYNDGFNDHVFWRVANKFDKKWYVADDKLKDPKEAVLAAIDTALDYLSKIKEEKQ